MSLENKVLNTDFMSTEEAEVFARTVDEQVQKAPDAVPERVREVLYAYNLLRALAGGKEAKVSYELFSPSSSMGVVSVVGSRLSFGKPELFMRAVNLATNFEVYPKTDGTVQMNFTFHGLKNKEQGGEQ